MLQAAGLAFDNFVLPLYGPCLQRCLGEGPITQPFVEFLARYAMFQHVLFHGSLFYKENGHISVIQCVIIRGIRISSLNADLDAAPSRGEPGE